jgi:hypothetical protein
METERTEKLSTLFDGKQAPQPSSEQLELISKWLALFSEMHHREISPMGTVAYIEGLRDLSCAEIQRGCDKALKEVDRMPTVAHIRQIANNYDDIPKAMHGDRGCSVCDYTGWKMIPNPSGGSWATKCDCRRTVANPD